ncbi:MAG: hypothetical protein ACYSX1_11365 [Planctomycetota bacterium]|jgi:uncharacterized membrane protein
MGIQGLALICLGLTPGDRWNAAGDPFQTGPSAETLFTIFAVVALIIAVVLLFYVIAKHKKTEALLEENIAKLVAGNDRLREQIAEIGQAQLEALEGACRSSGFYDLLSSEGGDDYAKTFLGELQKLLQK